MIQTDIGRLFNAAFRTRSAIPYAHSIACSAILKSTNHTFLLEILHSPGFAAYIHSFFDCLSDYRSESQTLFFHYLLSVIPRSKGEFWRVIDPSYFESTVMNLLYLDSCAAFLEAFLSLVYSESESYFCELTFCSSLLTQFLSMSPNSGPSFDIIRSALAYESFGLEFASTASFAIDQIFEGSFQARLFRYIDFLTLLYSRAIEHRHCVPWVRVGDRIFTFHPQICDCLIALTGFTRFEHSLSRLHLALCRDRHIVDDKTFQVLATAIDLTFRYPLNSVLHNFSVSALETFISNHGPIGPFLNATLLPEQIIVQYRTRSWEDRAFWGQLRLIADVIEPFVNDKRYPQWKSIVSAPNRQIDSILRDDDDMFGKTAAQRTDIVTVMKSPSIAKAFIWFAALSFVAIIYLTCAL
jgi:hypothetical protein